MNPITVTLFNQTYTIHEPNIGQLMEVESYRSMYTLGQYNTLRRSSLRSSAMVADTVEALSFFQVMCKGLSEAIKVQTYTELSPAQALELSRAFKKHVAAWYKRLEDSWYEDTEVSVSESVREAAKND